MLFQEYIGIDYSGAGAPDKATDAIQVFRAARSGLPERVAPDGKSRWSRKALAEWLAERLRGPERILVGLDHAFSFPAACLNELGLASWPAFLARFREEWKTDERAVKPARESLKKWIKVEKKLLGGLDRYRLTERWTSAAKSVFRYGVSGSVYHSSHAGIPWLLYLREQVGPRLHMWPFEGFGFEADQSVVAEIDPAIFKNRYAMELPEKHRGGKNEGDVLDAFAVCRWLQQTDLAEALPRYFEPPLDREQRELVRLEGWILGIA